MNLTEWAYAQGIHVTTAYRWYREGVLPVPARKAGRLILVSPDTAAARTAGRGGPVRAGVLHDQRADLDRQVARLPAWGGAGRMPVVRVEAEVGSRDERRPGQGAPAAGRPGGRRDRGGAPRPAGPDERRTGRGRPGARGRRLVVLDDSEVTDDLVRDMIEVLRSFCARPYGRRSARNRALKAIGCAHRTSARRPC